jgi:L,D-peptidoglycan transpeptidase YkuD (ErfK/YbiS/YcfS/YnhG family)
VADHGSKRTKAATPIGNFTLMQAFGSPNNLGTTIPWFRTDQND